MDEYTGWKHRQNHSGHREGEEFHGPSQEKANHIQASSVHSQGTSAPIRRDHKDTVPKMRSSPSVSTVKRRRITVRGKQFLPQDWRGLLAVLTTVGFFTTSTISVLRYQFTETMATIAVLSTTETLVLNWYFRSREEEN